jgi:methionine aminopeptidase
VIKVDFGVQVNGRICDSAFTLNFGDPAWDRLLEAVKDATNAGIRVSARESSSTEADRGARCEDVRHWRRSAGSHGEL